MWEGNQVWFILGGGAIFAAWPPLYAASFSGFYLAMLLVLIGFILRPVAINFRSKMDDPRWRARLGLAALRLGPRAVADLRRRLRQCAARRALPLRRPACASPMRAAFSACCSPFALLCGLVSVAMLLMQGAAWLAGKSDGAVAARARRGSARSRR